MTTALDISPERWELYLIRPGEHLRLGKLAADATDLCSNKKRARDVLKTYRKQINDLAETLAIENKRSFLLILQGMDASGKDGTVKKVFTGVNPQFCKVVSFKEPDREEREHDYLWRVARAMPAHGELGVFNRSQYEDVVARQARGDIGQRQAHMRLRQIAEMERAWVENGTVVRKVFLHISREQQTERFKKRLENPDKHWKLKESDFEDRRIWPKFQNIYEDVFERTATEHSPWYVVPADHKWYRDLAVAGIVLGALKAMKPKAPRPKVDLERFKL